MALRNRQRDWDMDKFVPPAADDHIGPTCHSCMDGAMSEEKAECRIMCICRDTSDGVAWIEVPDIRFNSAFAEICMYLFPEQQPDVTEAYVS